MPAKTPMYLKTSTPRKGKRLKLRDFLSGDLISPPLGEVRHRAHIGVEGRGDMFGDVSFLQGNLDMLPPSNGRCHSAEGGAEEDSAHRRTNDYSFNGFHYQSSAPGLLKTTVSMPVFIAHEPAPPKPPRLHLDEAPPPKQSARLQLDDQKRPEERRRQDRATHKTSHASPHNDLNGAQHNATHAATHAATHDGQHVGSRHAPHNVNPDKTSFNRNRHDATSGVAHYATSNAGPYTAPHSAPNATAHVGQHASWQNAPHNATSNITSHATSYNRNRHDAPHGAVHYATSHDAPCTAPQDTANAAPHAAANPLISLCANGAVGRVASEPHRDISLPPAVRKLVPSSGSFSEASSEDSLSDVCGPLDARRGLSLDSDAGLSNEDLRSERSDSPANGPLPFPYAAGPAHSSSAVVSRSDSLSRLDLDLGPSIMEDVLSIMDRYKMADNRCEL